MSADRDDLWRIITSDVYRAWSVKHSIDALKVAHEWDGNRRPLPRSAFALGLVNLIRANPKPPAPMPTTSVFALPGALVDNPRGGVEDMARYRAAGLRWALLNTEHGTIDNVWATVKTRCVNNNVTWGYWRHVFSDLQLHNLLLTAKADQAPLCGVNVERELLTILPPARVAELIRASGYTGKVCTILVGWQGYVENGVHKGPDLGAISDWPGFLEIFPQPNGSDQQPYDHTYYPPADKWPECRDHALALGLKTPLQLVQCYGDAQPSWYRGDRALYLLDQAAPTIEAWL